MSKAYVFPGQGSQAPGMGMALYDASSLARVRFAEADAILGFELSRILFAGSQEELTQTSVTQPAIYVHSFILAEVLNARADAAMVAGHSLGEFSALAAIGALSFEDGLRLVKARAEAMQRACDATPSTMAAIVGLEDDKVEELCAQVAGIVVPANYNTVGQLVISGEIPAVEAAIEAAKAAGAKLARRLNVNGAFHSPLMEPARAELAAAIAETPIQAPAAPVYQNVTAKGETDPRAIRENLIAQLTAPVAWTQTLQQMIADGATEFVELGPGKVLAGLLKRLDRTLPATSLEAPAAA